MSKRRVRPEELELWHQIARSADPMHPNRPLPKPRPAPKPAKPVKPREADPFPAFQLGQKAVPTGYAPAQPLTTAERLRRDPVAMDAKKFGQLKRGKLVPEARIDLHGMTLDQAHPALVRFVLTSHTRGLRLVLVITGKGKREDAYDPIPRRRGVLKSQVPQWLRLPPVAQAVLQVVESHRKHGGEGAYYVYLRNRK
jgi:DNA-nicking Smr family endonuclease